MIFENLTINRIIVHEIEQRGDDRQMVTPIYGKDLCALSVDALEALRQRVIAAMAKSSQCVEMDICADGEECMFSCARAILDAETDTDYIEHSSGAARRLASAQWSRKIPGGMLVIFDGTISYPEKRTVVLIKAESQNGFTRTQTNGSIGFEFLENLFLTPQSKLYKIGVFIEAEPDKANGDKPVEGYKAFIFDDGMSAKDKDKAALYFYEIFLNLRLQQSNARLTRKFYELTRTFIKDLDVTEEEKIDLNTFLYSYMKGDQQNNVQVRSFSDTYFAEAKLKDTYGAFMKENEFPTTAIPKDLSEVGPSLKKRKVRFPSDISLTAPADKFKTMIKVESFDAPEGVETSSPKWTRIIIRDKIIGQ